MKQQLEDLYKKLEEYSDFDKNNNCEKFLDTVDEIVLQKDPNSIQILLKYLDDQTEYSWVLETLSGAIEYYPIQYYIPNLLLNLEKIINKAETWVKSLLFHIFNSSEDLKYFRLHMNLVSKEVLHRLLKTMQQESPPHSTLIEELIQDLKIN